MTTTTAEHFDRQYQTHLKHLKPAVLDAPIQRKNPARIEA